MEDPQEANIPEELSTSITLGSHDTYGGHRDPDDTYRSIDEHLNVLEDLVGRMQYTTSSIDTETSGYFGSRWGVWTGTYQSGRDSDAVTEPTEEEKDKAWVRMKEIELKINNYMQEMETRLLSIANSIRSEIIDQGLNSVDMYNRARISSVSFDGYMSYLEVKAHQFRNLVESKYSERVRERKQIKKLKAANTPDQRSWMFCPIGIEYTFHPNASLVKYRIGKMIKDGEILGEVKDRHIVSARESACDDITEKFNKKVADISEISGKKTECKSYVDCNVVEVCSPVHKNWQSMLLWYRWMMKTLGSSVTPTSRTKGSGGAHLNCSIPKKHGYEFMYNLMVDIGNRPYINWIFNDPSDNHTANCMWDSSCMQDMVQFVEENSEKWMTGDCEFDKELGSQVLQIDDRDFAVRVKNNEHYELRCFDAIRNERDLYDIVAFTSAYLRWIYARTIKGERFESVGGHTEDLHFFHAVSRRQFNKLLRKIGLEPKDYRRFVDRNFETRRKVYGKKYLV